VCVGLIRYLELAEDPDASIARYVITNPPADFILHPTDKVYVFIPYSP
jgi:hypothetical protein